MSSAPHTSIPGYRPVLTTIGVLYVLLALMNLTRGAEYILGPFGFSPEILSSALFLDFYHWLFVHMLTIGVFLVLLGRLVVVPRHQAVVAWVLLALELHYTYLDFRTSVWGSGLYGDPRSLVLVAIGGAATLAVAYVCARSLPAVAQRTGT